MSNTVPVLSDYMKRVRMLVGDQNYDRFNRYDILNYINEARQQIAMEGECIRFLTPTTYATVVNQEVYPFSGVDLSSLPGALAVYDVKTVAMIWGTFQYVVQIVPYSRYQAIVRNYTTGFQYIPSVGAKFGQGLSGSFYLYPIANAIYPMLWDCFCIPIPLESDSDTEAVPYPWTDAVQFYAAYQLLNSISVTDDLNANQIRIAQSDRMWREYEKYMKRARALTERGMVGNFYGRG